MDYGNYGNYGEGGFNQDAQYSEYNNSQRQQTRSTLSPVTIKQIHDSKQPVPDGEFEVNNVSLNMVSFVGVIRKVENFTSGVTVTIEDGTGSVDVKIWVKENLSTPAEESEKYLALESKYVYVTGALKEMQLKKAIQHATIREVADYNEVLYHMLYAIENHLEAQGLLKGGPKQENGLFVSENGGGLSAKLDVTDQIMNVISSNTASMPEGVPVGWISDQLGILVDVVKEKCNQLSELGRVYQGYDEGSYCSV
ncbi:CIC11C00000001906 [Sungouiella intermedia]|uniref:CIC11C00000001906 n=1 Tax=Sungouiella intermedia TaxID=45354 RepID=A0A1L0CVL0_9ASCO|nr:CIC11C00000001906 [[Candida] intermedia]